MLASVRKFSLLFVILDLGAVGRLSGVLVVVEVFRELVMFVFASNTGETAEVFEFENVLRRSFL